MRNLTVHVLVTIPDERSFDACTLCFDSIRKGFPTAKIVVCVNDSVNLRSDLYPRIIDKIISAGGEVRGRVNKIHHAEWIHQTIADHEGGPLVIIDADTVFWQNCEDMEFPEGTLLAGYYVPQMWNDFAKCVSAERIHTSFMVFPDVTTLKEEIKKVYPYSFEKSGEYCPCDPFMPAVRFVEGQPLFWDTCANLYNMLPLEVSYHFGENEKARFDHLNSASFYSVMMERLDDNRGFALAHSDWVKNPTPGLWPVVDAYYRQKEIEGSVNFNN